MIRFTLDIPPQSCQFGKRVFVTPSGKPRFFNDSRKERYQKAVANLAQRYAPPQPLDGPLCVDMTFVLPRPKRLYRRQDRPDLIPCDTRPDRDNLQKGTQDALGACGFWHDDAQIAAGSIGKYYAEKDGTPRIEVAISPLNPLTDNYLPGELPGMILK